MANIPTISWDESTPAGFHGKALGATRIRELKTQIREIIDNDHIFESTGNGATWGYHNRVSFFPQISNPYPPANSGQLFVKLIPPTTGKPELFWIDEDGHYQQLTSGGQFVGGIPNEVRMYKGTIATIPIGWALCDGGGSPPRPNLIAKFIRGVRTDTTEPMTYDNQGSDTVALTIANMPAHRHTSQPITNGSHNHALEDGDSCIISTPSFRYLAGVVSKLVIESWSIGAVSGSGLHGHTVTTASQGTGTSWNNRPIYYEAAYIIKTALLA